MTSTFKDIYLFLEEGRVLDRNYPSEIQAQFSISFKVDDKLINEGFFIIEGALSLEVVDIKNKDKKYFEGLIKYRADIESPDIDSPEQLEPHIVQVIWTYLRTSMLDQTQKFGLPPLSIPLEASLKKLMRKE